MSLVELPTLEVPGGGATSGLRTARSQVQVHTLRTINKTVYYQWSPVQVRVILRNIGGKSCWDSSILYSLRDDDTLTRRLTSFPLPKRSCQREELMLTSSFVGGSGGIQPSPPRLSIRHRPPNSLPTWEDTAEDMDNLEDVFYSIFFFFFVNFNSYNV